MLKLALHPFEIPLMNFQIRVIAGLVLAQISIWPVFSAESIDSQALIKQVSDVTANIEKSPKDHFLYDERARLYCDLGQYDKVVEDCTKSLELSPEDLRAMHLRSIAYKALGKNAEAKADEDKLVSMAGQMGQRNSSKELDAATNKIKANPKDSKAYSDRAALYLSANNFNAALADCNKAISLNPKNKAAYFTRMGTYIGLHRNAEANLDKANFDKLNASDVAVFSKSAVSDYTHTLYINPKDDVALERRAQAYMDVGNYKDALRDLNKLIELRPDYETAYLMRATCFAKTNDKVHSDADMKTAQSLVK